MSIYTFLSIWMTLRKAVDVDFAVDSRSMGVIFCLFIFTSNYQTFCRRIKFRWHVIGCINHVLVTGLCFELLVRLYSYINPGCGKKFLVSHGNRNRVFVEQMSGVPFNQLADDHFAYRLPYNHLED